MLKLNGRVTTHLYTLEAKDLDYTYKVLLKCITINSQYNNCLYVSNVDQTYNPNLYVDTSFYRRLNRSLFDISVVPSPVNTKVHIIS